MIEYVAHGIIIDDIITPDGQKHMGVCGGGGPQTAWGMAVALDDGAKVGLVAKVGHDLPNWLLDPLRAANINLDGVIVTETPTPKALQIMNWDGSRTQVWKAAPEAIPKQLSKSWDGLPPSYQKAGCFHWGIHPADSPSSYFDELSEHKKVISLEAFRGPSQPLPTQRLKALLERVTIFSATEAEWQAILGEVDYRNQLFIICHWGIEYLLVRKGDAGADIYDCKALKYYQIPSVSTDVVDTVGAGNAFSGAFLATVFSVGAKWAACHASVAASYMIEQVGLPPQVPPRAAYNARLESIHAALVTKEIG